MSTLLISNVQLVNESLIHEADIFIKHGRIDRIGSDLNHLKADQVIDGQGKYLIPGFIDIQSRLSSAGDYQATIQAESKAAVAGGITSNFLIPHVLPINAVPSADEAHNFSSHANYAFWYPAVEANIEHLQKIDFSVNCGVYVDMSCDDRERRLDDMNMLQTIFENSSGLVAVQAEDSPTILECEESYRQVYGDNIPFNLHGSIRSSEACYRAASEALDLAINTQASVHLLNVSSVKEIELLAKLKKKSSLISADVSSHYLTFSDVDYDERGGLLKCRPSIKSDVDRAALMQGLLDHHIDFISSGHIPLSMKTKQGSYFDIPSGLPHAQYALPSVLEHYQDQILSLEGIVEKTSHAVADRFGITDRGYVKEGYWADLILLDLDGSFIARDEDAVSSAAWTIFNGNEFRSSVHTTIVNGEIVWSDGKIESQNTPGCNLSFNLNSAA